MGEEALLDRVGSFHSPTLLYQRTNPYRVVCARVCKNNPEQARQPTNPDGAVDYFDCSTLFLSTPYFLSPYYLLLPSLLLKNMF